MEWGYEWVMGYRVALDYANIRGMSSVLIHGYGD